MPTSCIVNRYYISKNNSVGGSLTYKGCTSPMVYLKRSRLKNNKKIQTNSKVLFLYAYTNDSLK